LKEIGSSYQIIKKIKHGSDGVSSFLRRKKSLNQAVGVAYEPDGISLAHIKSGRDGLSLQHIGFYPVKDPAERGNELKKIISETGLKGVPAYFVLGYDQYSLMQIEAPEVPPEELKSAVRWRIKDLIDYHLDDAEIEIIHLPESKRAGAPRLMYVLASRTAFVKTIIDDMNSAGLDLAVIDVMELALRNMTFADVEENRASAFLYLSENFNLIEICDNGSLCLSRHINMDFNRIDPLTGEGKMEMMDMLSLEVQRSMDYYESQFANGSATKINMVTQVPISVSEFMEVADSYLTAPVQPLAALEKIQGIDQYENQLVARCLPPIGAAVRDYVWKT